jgi:hypothetical protein
MAVDHRNRRGAEPIRRPDRRVLIASPARCGCTAGAGGVDPWDLRCPTACQPGSTSRGRPNHQPSGPCLFTELYTDGQKAIPQHVDDAGAPAQLDRLVATIGLVAVAGVVCRVRVSAGRRPLGCIRGRSFQPRYLDPALRRPLLTGQRQAVVSSDSAR